MKYLRILLGLLLMSGVSFASEDTFSKDFSYLSSYKEAHEKSLKSNKPLMILFVTTSCPWCQKLKHQVLKKEEVNTFIHNAFIPVMLDKETDAFPQELLPFAVPTLSFVGVKKEKEFFSIIGYKPLDEALNLLKQAHAKAKEGAL